MLPDTIAVIGMPDTMETTGSAIDGRCSGPDRDPAEVCASTRASTRSVDG